MLDGLRLHWWQTNYLSRERIKLSVAEISVLPKIISLVSMVLLLGWMFYFLAGGLPLLILKYDHPSDSRLVRGFFNVHYLALMTIATVGTISAAISDRSVLAATIACIGLVGFTARRLILSRMDWLRATMSAADDGAIKTFRWLHITGLALNVFLMIGLISTMALSSADIVSCVETPPGCKGEGCRVQCSLL